jgi:hypothetical protein
LILTKDSSFAEIEKVSGNFDQPLHPQPSSSFKNLERLNIRKDVQLASVAVQGST